MKLKNKGELKKLLFHEGYSVLAFWENGTWANVGSGYGGEQDGDNSEILLRRANFYDTTKKQAALMIKAIELALGKGTDPFHEYEKLER